MITGSLGSQAVYLAAKLGIADLLAPGPKHVDELAIAADADAPSLYRVLRALASCGIFVEQNDRVFELTPTAELLRSDSPGSLRDLAIFMGEDWHWRVWGQTLYSVRTGKAAWDQKQPGAWVIVNTRSSIDPFLTYSDRRELREKAWRMFVNRGDNGDEHDNNAIITEVLQLRAERAKFAWISHLCTLAP